MFYEYKMIITWSNGNKSDKYYELKSIAEHDKQEYLDVFGNEIKRITIRKI